MKLIIKFTLTLMWHIYCSAKIKEPLLHLEVKTYNLKTNFIFNVFVILCKILLSA